MPGVGTTASTGNGRIRLVDVGTQGTHVDFCIRQSGTTDWGRPIFRDGGTDALCSVGLAYGQATVPFSVPTGKIDVKAIPAGQTCSAAATSQTTTPITIGDQRERPRRGGPRPRVAAIVRPGAARARKRSPR